MKRKMEDLFGETIGEHSKYLFVQPLARGTTVETFIVRDVIAQKILAAKVKSPPMKEKEAENKKERHRSIMEIPGDAEEDIVEQSWKSSNKDESRGATKAAESREWKDCKKSETTAAQNGDEGSKSSVVVVVNQDHILDESTDTKEETSCQSTYYISGAKQGSDSSGLLATYQRMKNVGRAERKAGNETDRSEEGREQCSEKDNKNEVATESSYESPAADGECEKGNKRAKKGKKRKGFSFESDPLYQEYKVIEALNKRDPEDKSGVVRVVEWIGVIPRRVSMMVMELCGPDLRMMHVYCGQKFSIFTVLTLAHQMLSALEFLHRHHLIHCDLKPENWVTGVLEKCNRVILADFGTARTYWDRINKRHIEWKDTSEQGKVGTPKYCSINAQRGTTLGRSDDLQSLCYLLVYFFTGALPWCNKKPSKEFENEECGERRQVFSKVARENYPELWNRMQYLEQRRIQDAFLIAEKEKYTLFEMAESMPLQFRQMMQMIDELSWDQRPDYTTYFSLLQAFYKSAGFKDGDKYFDWILKADDDGVGGTDQTYIRLEGDNDDWKALLNASYNEPENGAERKVIDENDMSCGRGKEWDLLAEMNHDEASEETTIKDSEETLLMNE